MQKKEEYIYNEEDLKEIFEAKLNRKIKDLKLRQQNWKKKLRRKIKMSRAKKTRKAKMKRRRPFGRS
ncbi:hypothetical protein LCGC14_1388220, partial [marine sediment metagenome]